MFVWQALVLGVVEGITEFLPISSTGHLILSARLLGLAQSEFLKSFQIAIQSGAILGVIVLYGKILVSDLKLMRRVALAFLPTAVIGAIFYKFIKGFLLGSEGVVLGALFLGGLAIILLERFYHKRQASTPPVTEITYKHAFLIGLFQCLAMIPGVSRAAATIMGGLALEVDRKKTVEFSFLLAVPTMLAATGYDLLKTANSFTIQEAGLLGLGFIAAFIVAIISIKFLLHYIKRNDFTLFGYYRMLLVVIFILLR